jgi:hypothetical protein
MKKKGLEPDVVAVCLANRFASWEIHRDRLRRANQVTPDYSARPRLLLAILHYLLEPI